MRRAAALAVCLAPLAVLPARAAVDARDLESFLDGFVAAQTDRFHVPGAVFVWVEGGAPRFAKGWGVADLETRAPVDPERTLFRVASISKLFTATAAMQLRERGALDFRADVNGMLELFQVPEHPSGPITMAHLLTHTAGFDDRNIGMGAPDAALVLPLGEYLAAHLPPRVLPAGDVISYSNHGYALAGYLVELRSGRLFADYVRENIFAPLGIERAGWGQPGRADAVQATGYEWRGGRQRARPPRAFSQIPPAAELTISAAEIARFMLAHLQGGRLGAARILADESVREMQTVQFPLHPELGGWGYGFVVSERNGRRLATHSGWTDGFCSGLVLLPDEGAGFFVSMSTDCRFGLLDALEDALLDRYFPAPAAPEAPASPAPAAPAAPENDLARLAGAYWPSRHSRTTIERTSVGLYEARVSANPDGTLTLERPGADPLRLARVGPLRFDEIDGPRRVAFRERDGRVTDLFVGPIAWERVPFLATRRATLAIQGVCLAVLLSWPLTWPWRAAARRRARRAAALDPAVRTQEAMLRGAGAAAALAAAAWLGWAIGATLVLADLNLFDLVRGVPPSLRRLLALPVLGALLTGPVAVFAGLALLRRAATPGVRTHYALVAAAAIALTLCAIQWNWLVPGV